MARKRSSRSSRPRVAEILRDVKELAAAYYLETGKPLGVTGEVAEFEASRILDLELADPRQEGYDAVRKGKRHPKKIQVKGRRLTRLKTNQRIGAISLDHEWDSVMLVLLDEQYEAIEIHEADRHDIEKALGAPGSKARNVRGQLGVSKFKSIGKMVWRA